MFCNPLSCILISHRFSRYKLMVFVKKQISYVDMLLLGLFSVFLATSTAYQVQESGIIFTLYNRNVSGVVIDKDNLCLINPNAKIKFLVHGKGGSALPSWIPKATEIFLGLGDYNIIQVDWTELSTQGVDLPIFKASDAAYYIAKLVRRIHQRLSVPLDNFHLIGHSLGGHVVGFTGKHVRHALNALIGRITGLDPANDDFSYDPDLENGLRKTDGFLVVAIHTDDTGIGSRGNIDFYANGGSHPQPGCPTNICSHIRSCDYFNEALENPIAFLGTNCESYEKYLQGRCEGNERVELGNSLLGYEGDFYFATNEVPPFSQS